MAQPVYELKINEEKDSYVNAVALVLDPAIESNFIAFSKITELKFATDDGAHELIGPAMIPSLLIKRQGYDCFASAETIKEIAQVFFQKGLQNNLNLFHTDTPANSFIYQSFIVDSTKGINSPKGIDAPDGTWILGVKVNDDNVWDKIKSGELKGFSVEGLFQLDAKDAEDTTDEKMQKAIEYTIAKTIAKTIAEMMKKGA